MPAFVRTSRREIDPGRNGRYSDLSWFDAIFSMSSSKSRGLRLLQIAESRSRISSLSFSSRSSLSPTVLQFVLYFSVCTNEAEEA